MRITMKTTMAGPNISAAAGQIIVVEQATAERLVGGGFAQYVDRKVEPEAAVVAPSEKAVMPRPKRGKK